jgi:hypothetical protein
VRLRRLKDESRWQKKMLPVSVIDNSVQKDQLRKAETASGAVAAVKCVIEDHGYSEPRGCRLISDDQTAFKYWARCSEDASVRERELGSKATRRLRDLLWSAKVIDLTIVPCACRLGIEGTARCNFGRKCGRLLADSRDVGDLLTSEGLAVRYQCGPTSSPHAHAPCRPH